MAVIDIDEETLGYDPTAISSSNDGIAHFDVGGRTADGQREVRRSAVPAEIRQLVRDRQMTRPNSARAAVHCLVLVLAWAGLTVAGVAAGSLWAWVPIWLCQALILHGAYSAMHDAAHGTLFDSRAANRVACFAWSIPLGLNASLWRCWHLEHHRATTTKDDPEPKADLTNIALYFGAFPVAGLSMFASFYWHSLRSLVGAPPGYANRRSARGAVRRDALWMLVFTAGIVVAGVTATHWLLFCWLVPLATYWLAVSLVFGLPEHYSTSRSSTQIDATRSVASNRLISFVVWNSHVHAAHHLVPTVTYRHLLELDRALGERVTYRSASYTRYHFGLMRQLLSGPVPADAARVVQSGAPAVERPAGHT